MRSIEPERLPKGTPNWFKEWHSNSYWHFAYRVESRLSFQGKLLWLIFSAIIITAVANVFLG